MCHNGTLVIAKDLRHFSSLGDASLHPPFRLTPLWASKHHKTLARERAGESRRLSVADSRNPPPLA